MTAIVSVTLITTGFPVGLTKPDGSNVVYVTAREPDAQRKWELWGISTTARTSIGKLGEGDTVEVRGALAVKLEARVAVLQINVAECQMILPIAPKPKPRCGSGTRPIDPAKVAEANARFAERNRGGASCERRDESAHSR
jgi:hypothetical protein